jgi:nuclear cap-binding protein subunit 1
MPDTITNREGIEVPINISSVIRAITTQCLLHIGARSFSHLLNAIERYLPVLRVLASGTISSSATVTSGPGVGDADAKADILLAVSEFWRRNSQMINIVFDKLMQYQIVDPSDVVAWAFTNSGRVAGGEKISAEEATTKIDAFVWGVIEGALDKANGRVAIAKRKVTALRKEEDDSRARDIAKGGDVGNMDVDAVGTGAATNDAEKPADSPQLTSALKVQSVLIREQKMVLSRTLNEFVRILSETSESAVLREEGWHNRANWGDDEWETWETWGWYRNFCRVVSKFSVLQYI